VRFAAVVQTIVDRAQAQFGLEGAKHRLQIGELDGGAPQCGAVQTGIVAAQDGMAGSFGLAVLARLPGVANGGGGPAIGAQLDAEVVVAGHAGIGLLETADAWVGGIKMTLHPTVADDEDGLAGFGLR
jgi:hypothetical protein